MPCQYLKMFPPNRQQLNRGNRQHSQKEKLKSAESILVLTSLTERVVCKSVLLTSNTRWYPQLNKHTPSSKKHRHRPQIQTERVTLETARSTEQRRVVTSDSFSNVIQRHVCVRYGELGFHRPTTAKLCLPQVNVSTGIAAV